ncbi:MAG: hypothetical protein QM723_38350 [Myxococcaceae bacterium]
MKRFISMMFGLWFASMWLGCGMGEDEAWSDEDGVVPAVGDEYVIDGPAVEEPVTPDLDVLSEAAGEAE